MGREKIGSDDEQTSSRQKIGRRVVEKARDYVDDAVENRKQNESSGSFLGDVLNTVMGIVGESSNDEVKHGKASGRKPVASNEGRVASVASNVADQLRRKK